MSAKVSKKFNEKFELNEESLRRIHSDIRKRVPTEKQKDITFEIFREDSLIFRTTELDRVLSENNDSTQKIKSIKIEYLDESLAIELLFHVEDGAKLSVKGEERDTVFLISSELGEYIQKEVSFLSGGTWMNRCLLAIISLAAILLFVFTLKPPHITPDISETLSTALKSTDSNEKLNYIINNLNNSQTTDSRSSLIALIPAAFMLIFLLSHLNFAQYFFPGNIFLIGKQISIINNRRGFVRNIFWCGIVALAIAMITGYYFLWLSK